MSMPTPFIAVAETDLKISAHFTVFCFLASSLYAQVLLLPAILPQQKKRRWLNTYLGVLRRKCMLSYLLSCSRPAEGMLLPGPAAPVPEGSASSSSSSSPLPHPLLRPRRRSKRSSTEWPAPEDCTTAINNLHFQARAIPVTADFTRRRAGGT